MEPTFTQKVVESEPQANMCCPQKLTWKGFLILLGVVASILILWQYISSPLVVTVTGTGKASVPATSSTITATISLNSDSAQNAISAVKAKSDSIKSILKGSGVPEEDVAVSQITSYPASMVTAGASGYQAALQITAKTARVSTIADLVASLYAAGATLVSQPVLSVEDQEALEAKAMDAAVKDAKSQISKIALKNLRLIRRKIALYEDAGETTSTITSKADAVTVSQNQLAAQNGVFEITKTVSVSYKLW